MEKYTALIIDIKNSREYQIKDRKDIQYYLINCISFLNQFFRPIIECEVIVSGGDEVQGLFCSATGAFLYYRLFNMFITPVETRAGIGVGDWSIRVEGGISTEQDGAAYHNARKAIDSLAERDDYNISLLSGSDDDLFINTYLHLSDLLLRQQTVKQNQFLLLTEMLFPLHIENTMVLEVWPKAQQLLSQKISLEFCPTTKGIKQSDQRRTTHPKQYFYGIKELPELYLSSTDQSSFARPKGLAQQLADITGTSRQNAEKVLKAGNIYQLRELHMVTLKMMDKMSREGSL